MSTIIPSLTNTNANDRGLLQDIECFTLDLDGTLYLGDRWIDGALDFLRKISASGRHYYFLTNNSSRNPEAYLSKLRRMGLEVESDSIITSGQATTFYLKNVFSGKRAFLLGNELLTAQFQNDGIHLVDVNPEIVVIGFDTTLDYQKLCRVCDFIRSGLPFIATHPDINCPTENGFIPDVGSILAFIHASTFRWPDTIIGKPYGWMADYVFARVGIPKQRIAMVGDRLYTDIAFGKNNGMKSILVLSGETHLEDVKADGTIPDLVFDSVREIIPFL